ncbi:hypothetical protein N9Y92_00155 [Chlamydiales bacterium]|nr:hypothetical protein [Chlamydiales bacterium]
MLVKETNKNISIIGAGFSQGQQFIPPNQDDLTLDMKCLNSIEIDKDKK